jgi:hypothetical protein
MKKYLIMSLLTTSMISFAQTNLVTEGQTYTNSTTGTWIGVNIPRSVPTLLVFKNNSITSSNRVGYLLQAGDEGTHAYNHNLDRAVITGNRLNWHGTDMESITHGLFTGHNSDVVVKYNYLNLVPMGIIRKSTNNMSNTSGGVAYNIVKGGTVGMVVKGMSNVNIFNNTFYQNRTTSQTWRPLVHIYTNTDSEGYSVAHGTKIYNNIFYTKYRTFSITIDTESLNGFECDYNVYWCESGAPLFSVDGNTKTFEQWQAMGYDQHSVVKNPNFRDLVNFVPAERLNHGRDLGPDWANGLSRNAVWGRTDPATTAQNGPWQVGAVVLGDSDSASVDSEPFSIYPNPAREYVTVENRTSGTDVFVMKIYDLSGKIRYEVSLEPGVNDHIPINLEGGMYLVHIVLGSVSRFVQRLVVIE